MAQKSDFKDALLREGIVSLDLLNEALREQERNRESLIDILIKSGKVDEKKFASLVSRYYGYTTINPTTFVIEKEILNFIPQKTAERYTLLPISFYDNTLTVAFANPTDLKVVDEIRMLLRIRIKVVVAEAGLLKKCIQKYYGLAITTAPQSSMMQKSLQEDEEKLNEIVKMIDQEQMEDHQAPQELLKIAYETPVIKLVNMLLMEGIRRRASDIFIEPWENFIRVRTRVDGLLEEIVCPHKSLGAAIVSRIKIMSELNIAEHRIPQDGRFKIKINNKEVDMRVSILPTSWGEKVCLRILDTNAQSHDIAKLGFDEKEQTIIRDCARRPHGMILVTGPTGSGKTTTLYSVLKYLDCPEVNITTVEDPVEYQLPGINQVNVKEQIGLTFPAALRSILRQDPDIILIGEIRDNATLDIAVKAALTGHLVLSTLHTNDAASSVTRMLNMGLEPFLISSTVLMISAQRLVRRICPRCRAPIETEKSLLNRLRLDEKSIFYKGRGCAQCRQSGYSGRTVITEILQMTPEVRQRILKGDSADQIKDFAIEKGMSSLRDCALKKALAGETTLEEVMRVTSENQNSEEKAEKLAATSKAA